jgi:hypothetical protein
LFVFTAILATEKMKLKIGTENETAIIVFSQLGAMLYAFITCFPVFGHVSIFSNVLSVLFSACPGFPLFEKHDRSLQMRRRRHQFQFLDY